jgi:hypothetical protein
MATATKKRPSKAHTVWDSDGNRLLAIPLEAHTYRGFLKWVMSDSFPEKVPVTYCNGNVTLDMSEGNIDTQSEVKIAVYSTLGPLVKEIDFGRIWADGILLCNESADISNNPDGVAARWKTIESKKLTYIIRKESLRAVEGTPDWVMEIVSDSSVGKDLHQLWSAYHKAGIEEYWLIDARSNEISFQILGWQPANYIAMPAKGGWVHSRVFEREFRLTRRRDRDGGWVL